MKEQAIEVLGKLVARSKELWALFRAWVHLDPRRGLIVSGGVLVLAIYSCSRGEENVHYIYESKDKQFSQDRVIENPYKHIAESKMDMMEDSENRLHMESREIKRQISDIKAALDDLKSTMSRAPQSEKDQPINEQPKMTGELAKPLAESQLPVDDGSASSQPPSGVDSGAVKTSRSVGKSRVGPFSVTFPVQVKREEKATGVLIPTGSYVKAKIVGGVQVPMGETYPALLQLDYAFVKPNNRRIDLTGCFIVAKAEGDLSTERLKMSPYSMSCYNAQGLAFRKDKLIGWANDPSDNDFALKAEVNLNEGRLARSAFAKALIDGLGASIERKSRSIGGKGIDDASPDIILKDSGQKVGSEVMAYYQQYLQGLRPTMKAGSGRDAWLVMGTDIDLPYSYFRKEESGESKFNYITNNLVD